MEKYTQLDYVKAYGNEGKKLSFDFPRILLSNFCSSFRRNFNEYIANRNSESRDNMKLYIFLF